MAAFAIGGIMLALGLSGVTFALTSTYLVTQRETSAVRQARANARLVRSLLRSPNPDVARLLGSLGTRASARSVVRYADAWFAASADVGPDSLPASLRDLVLDEETPARQRYHHEGQPVVSVGIPLGNDNAYFEIFPLAELDGTLRTLQYSLAAAGLLTVGGSVGLGHWASRRVLRPVSDIGKAAAAIAAGRLDARLDVGRDAELFALATGFNAMVDSLQDRIERDARFAADVSHELRSPLTTLRSAVELMMTRRGRLDARSARALDLMAEEVERFEGLVQDLLEISRYDAGVAVPDLEPVDLPALVERVLRSEGVDGVAVEFEGDERTHLLDRRRLEQAARNIVRNASAYAGGIVRSAVDVHDDSLVVMLEDRGPGVPPDDREAVFHRFFRGHTAGRRSSGEGVGLGLALVQEHARLLGGQVWVEDATPSGARFVIQLPRHRG